MVFAAQKGECGGQKARGRSCGSDVKFGAPIGDVSPAADHAKSAALFLHADSERGKTAEQTAGVLGERSAGEKDLAVAECGQNERAVEQALGGGGRRLRKRRLSDEIV